METKGGEDLGISDIIAGFIQQELDQAGGALELQRADLAQRFNCVPSQINYVMSTRFSPEHGYIVESRRGGGGYIRITRVQVDHRRQAGRGQRTGDRPEPGPVRGHQPGAGTGVAVRHRQPGSAECLSGEPGCPAG